MNLIPYQNEPWRGTQGQWQLPDPCTVHYADFASYCTNAYSARCGVVMQPGGKDAALHLIRDTKLRSEEYFITVSKSVTITSATERGVIWALTTLFLGTDNGAHECGSINDAPRYRHRGFHFDSARHYFTVETLESVLDTAGLVKMNTMHWHLTDDQGWRIESEQYPLLTQGGAFYTKEEIRRVVEFAKTRGIDVIPEIDLPGHTSAVLAAYPQFGCFNKNVPLRTGGGIFPIILCAGKDEALLFIKDILTETAELFPYGIFHIGGDEAPKSEWEQCPHCTARMEAHGITELEDLQGWLMVQAVEHLKTLGKRAMCWCDCLAARDFPRDVLVQQWMELTKESRTLPFWRAGGEVVFSDGPYCYFDYPVAVTSLKKAYSYRPAIRGTDCSKAANTRGVECCLWTENVETPKQLGRMLFPRLFATAEVGWSRTHDYARFERSLTRMLAYLDSHGIHYSTPADANPTGKERKRQLELFFSAVSSQDAASEGSVDTDMVSLIRLLRMVFGLKDLPLILRFLLKRKH